MFQFISTVVSSCTNWPQINFYHVQRSRKAVSSSQSHQHRGLECMHTGQKWFHCLLLINSTAAAITRNLFVYPLTEPEAAKNIKLAIFISQFRSARRLLVYLICFKNKSWRRSLTRMSLGGSVCSLSPPLGRLSEWVREETWRKGHEIYESRDKMSLIVICAKAQSSL